MVQRVHPARDAGFVLPLSITGALVLLLSSLSLQTLVLHTRQVQAAERTRLQAEDRLASGAQRLAADFLPAPGGLAAPDARRPCVAGLACNGDAEWLPARPAGGLAAGEPVDGGGAHGGSSGMEADRP